MRIALAFALSGCFLAGTVWAQGEAVQPGIAVQMAAGIDQFCGGEQQLNFLADPVARDQFAGAFEGTLVIRTRAEGVEVLIHPLPGVQTAEQAVHVMTAFLIEGGSADCAEGSSPLPVLSVGLAGLDVDEDGNMNFVDM